MTCAHFPDHVFHLNASLQRPMILKSNPNTFLCFSDKLLLETDTSCECSCPSFESIQCWKMGILFCHYWLNRAIALGYPNTYEYDSRKSSHRISVRRIADKSELFRVHRKQLVVCDSDFFSKMGRNLCRVPFIYSSSLATNHSNHSKLEATVDIQGISPRHR